MRLVTKLWTALLDHYKCTMNFDGFSSPAIICSSWLSGSLSKGGGSCRVLMIFTVHVQIQIKPITKKLHYYLGLMTNICCGEREK